MEKNVHLLLSGSNAEGLDLLARRLTEDGYCTHIIHKAQDMYLFLDRFPIAAVFLDFDVFGNEAYSLAGSLRERQDLFTLIIGASHTCSFDAVKAFDSGAEDVLIKPLDTDELSARLRARLRRLKSDSPVVEPDAILRYGDLTLDTDSLTLYKGEISLSVTLSEYKLLVKLMRSPGRIFSKRDLYAYISCGSEPSSNTLLSDDNTVMVHISKLRDKIENDPRRPEFIKTIRGKGYCFDATPAEPK